jgi:predicted transcriptional regulator with HTH domain
MDCYSSCYSKEEQAASKTKYFAERKVKSVKVINNFFKIYLAYTKEVKPDSDYIRTYSDNRKSDPSNINSNTLLGTNNSFKNSNSDYNNSIANFIIVFITSKTTYNVREIIKQFKKRKAIYILKSIIKKPPSSKVYIT